MRAVWSLDFSLPSDCFTRPVENDFFRESAENMFAAFCKGAAIPPSRIHAAYFSALILWSVGQLNTNIQPSLFILGEDGSVHLLNQYP